MNEWFNTEEFTPLPDREILVKDTSREFPPKETRKQHSTRKYNGRKFGSDLIKQRMIEGGLTQWQYVEGKADDIGLVESTQIATLLNLLCKIELEGYTTFSQVKGEISNTLDDIYKLDVDINNRLDELKGVSDE